MCTQAHRAGRVVAGPESLLGTAHPGGPPFSALNVRSGAFVRVGPASPRFVPPPPAVTDHWLNVSHWLISVTASTTDLTVTGSCVVPVGKSLFLGDSTSDEPVNRADLYLKGTDSANWSVVSWNQTEEDADAQISSLAGTIRIQPGAWGWDRDNEEWTVSVYGEGSAVVTETTEDDPPETLVGSTSWVLAHDGLEEIGEFMTFKMKAVFTEINEGLSPPPLSLEIFITPDTYYPDWF